jgi:MFS family permease
VIATFSMLFLTYCMQDTFHYSPVMTGVAYLPMIVALIGSAQLATNVLLPRFGPKVMVATGMVMAAGAMLLLTRIGLHSSYGTAILPALVILGFGFGQVMAPSASVATVGLTSDAGVASAMVNTSQQVGGSVGTSLLNTLAASAVTAYALANRATAASVATLQAEAMVHGYRVVFAYAAVFLVAGAVIAGLLLRRGAVASLEITGRGDQPGVTAPESSGEPSVALSSRVGHQGAHCQCGGTRSQALAGILIDSPSSEALRGSGPRNARA